MSKHYRFIIYTNQAAVQGRKLEGGGRKGVKPLPTKKMKNN